MEPPQVILYICNYHVICSIAIFFYPAPADFENAAETLEFTFSNTTLCVEVQIVDDNDLENTEEFTVRLSPDGTLPAGLRITPDLATVSIFDNEGIHLS